MQVEPPARPGVRNATGGAPGRTRHPWESQVYGVVTRPMMFDTAILRPGSEPK